MSDFDFAAAAATLLPAASEAGARIMHHYREGTAVEQKADNSPVTLADIEAEAVLLKALAALAPDIPVVSEESVRALPQGGAARFFLVDPLDGTKEFIKRRTDFTVNVALIENAAPVFGLVYAPALGLVAFTQQRGEARLCPLQPGDAPVTDGSTCLQLRTRTPPAEGMTAVVSASHLDPETEAYLEDLPIAARASAGSSLKFIRLAQAEADIYPRFGPTMEWDTAAGHAVLLAAGGAVLKPDGTPLLYGKTESGLKNHSFIAFGRAPLE